MNRLQFLKRTALVVAMSCVAPLALAQVKLTLGHGAAPDNPRNVASLKFAEVVKAKTNGRVDVQVSPSAQLGDDAAMVTALRTGALQQGVVDGQENPLMNIHASKPYEVQKHLALTAHKYEMTPS